MSKPAVLVNEEFNRQFNEHMAAVQKTLDELAKRTGAVVKPKVYYDSETDTLVTPKILFHNYAAEGGDITKYPVF